MPARLRVTAGIIDLALLVGLTVFLGNRGGLGTVGMVIVFMVLRFMFEVPLVALCGRTPGKALLKLHVSESRLWPTPPTLRKAFVRHLIKSGDLLFGLIIILTAIGASVGSPDSSRAYLALVVIIPLTVLSHIGFISTPLILLASLIHGENDRPIHDQWSKTYVFATSSLLNTHPVVFSDH